VDQGLSTSPNQLSLIYYVFIIYEIFINVNKK